MALTQPLIFLLLVVVVSAVSASAPPVARLDSFLTSQFASPSSDSAVFDVFVVPHAIIEPTLAEEIQTRLAVLRQQLKAPLSEVPRAMRRGVVYELRSVLAEESQRQLLELLGQVLLLFFFLLFFLLSSASCLKSVLTNKPPFLGSWTHQQPSQVLDQSQRVCARRYQGSGAAAAGK